MGKKGNSCHTVQIFHAAIEKPYFKIGPVQFTKERLKAVCREHGIDINKLFIVARAHRSAKRSAVIACFKSKDFKRLKDLLQ